MEFTVTVDYIRWWKERAGYYRGLLGMGSHPAGTQESLSGVFSTRDHADRRYNMTKRCDKVL